MTDHRAPSRLAASSRPNSRRTLPPSSPPGTYRLPPSQTAPIPEQDYYDPNVPSEESPAQVHAPREMAPRDQARPYNAYVQRQYQEGVPGDDQGEEPVYDPPEDTPSRQPWQNRRSLSARAEQAAAPPDEELSKAERHQLLIDTIKLYDEEWQLARIWARGETNWLVAYLVPRAKRMDLNTALRKNKALTIIIDSRGNTQVKLPKRRKWFFGLF